MPVSSSELSRVFSHLPGHQVVLRAVPGFPIVAASAGFRAAASVDGDLEGRPWQEAFPENPELPGSAALQHAAFERVVRERRPSRHEQRYDVRDPDTGRFVERYWAVADTPIPGADGEVEFVLHHAEQTATEHRHGAMAILDAMTEGVYTLDRQWRFNYVNPEAYRILRREPGSLPGQVVWDAFPGAREQFAAAYEQAMHARRPTSFTAYYEGLEGWYEVTAHPAPEGIAVYFHDVTARVLAERDTARVAAESDQRTRIYETALNSTPDFVYVFDLDHRAMYANEALLKVWGVDDVRGKTWIELGYEQWHADLHDAELAQVIRTRAPIRGEIPFTGTNGRRVYDYIFAPVLDPAGEVVAVAGTTRDVTERQAAEQILREHAGRLADADRAKDEFLATLSHELRNPLAPLRNGLQILRLTTEPGTRAATVHAMMDRQVDHLVRLVDDLLEVSRITRGTLSLRSERIDLESIVQSALETSRPLIVAAGHRLELDLPQEPLWLLGDRVRLAQVLANLLNNAAKYSEPGGRIGVAARRDGDAVRIAVSDTGIGIVPAAIPRLFEMFTRGDRDSSYHQGGLGIGLALARRLAEMHGGSVDAESDGPGHGSTFVVRLPLAGEAAAPADDVQAPQPRLALRVLVADDNADVGDSLAETLRLLGADVRVERNGPDALAAFPEFRPDVAILDIGMPRVTGYDVARAVRARGESLPLVALTGWGQDADRDRALQAGFDHHLVKPVAIPALVELLGRFPRRADAASG